ncbi:hypothetical protein OG2516_14985 [Oceanicola granulosus HTCC2516]|uniref:Protein kinase domain-containing protein n=1 Tax=Oceanicola granulosus (strain ATCC BAA-861 / DSM 15982 / KCTC 12143 / HTCC2516) TaxID=314256 RepID=Q2CER8_OCEGH|nr:hypothetical protein OG2516_14985 [Oceanicola granulosus HTCC2516]
MFAVVADGRLEALADELDIAPERAVVAFNPLLQAEAATARARPFHSEEVARAAHLLASLTEESGRLLRVTRSEAEAEAVARRLLDGPAWAALDAAVEARRAEMASAYPVLADLSRFKYRAKVERVRYGEATAVLKTYRRNARDAMAREAGFAREIGRLSDVPPRILEQTDNALLFEDIDNALRVRRILGLRVPLPLPLARVRELAEFVRLCCAQGFDAIDLTPRDNVLIDAETGRLRAIDFEFATRRDGPVRPEESYCLSGVPASAQVARPLLNAMEEDPYPSKWRPYTGLSKRSFLRDPPWLQHLKRVALHPFWLVGFAAGAMVRRRRHRATRGENIDAVAWRGRG